jgi:DnaJ like chaperone protein
MVAPTQIRGGRVNRSMSIWGKILGGAAGFALGGPFGALLGAAAGHAVDWLHETNREPALATAAGGRLDERAATRQIAFTIAVIVLGAKMAKADGRVTREEVAAFKQVFQVPPEELGNVGRLFDQARKDSAGFETYARQVSKMFPRKSKVLEELIDGLFHIAKADGVVSPEELRFLERVAQIFGFAAADFERIRHAHIGPDHADPYTILGVTRSASDTEIKAAWRRAIRETHPDKLIAKGMPKEFIDLATEKMARINAAYDEIAKARGIH